MESACENGIPDSLAGVISSVQLEPSLHRIAKRDREAMARLRLAIRYLLERREMRIGNQARLAAFYGVSRQRVHQIVVEERRLLDEAN
jgi:hypothetical protein